MPDYTHARTVAAAINLYADIEYTSRMRLLHLKLCRIEIVSYSFPVRRGYRGYNFKALARVARHYSRRRRARYAFHSARVGNDYAFNVFKYVAANGNFHFFGHCPQSIP